MIHSSFLWFEETVQIILPFLIPGNIFAFALVYLCIQRILRCQRERTVIRQYRESTSVNSGSPTGIQQPSGIVKDEQADGGRQGLDLSKMSFTQASEIQRQLAHLEFPYTFAHSLELGFIQV